MAKNAVRYLYLKKATINGFRSIVNLDVTFTEGLNVLIGKNGVGKSNLLKILSQALRPNGMPHDTSIKSMQILLETSEADSSFEVEYTRLSATAEELEMNPSEKYYIGRSFKVDGEPAGQKRYSNRLIPNDPFGRARVPSFNYILRQKKLRFPFGMLLEYNTPYNVEYLDQPGKITFDYNTNDFNFNASFYIIEDIVFALHDKLDKVIDLGTERELEREEIDQLITLDFLKEHLAFDTETTRVLSNYTPIKDIRFNPHLAIYNDSIKITVDNVKVEFFVNDNWYPWNQLSDGTKRLFYIISQILCSENRTILLEEPELGIHPHQLFLLMQFLREQEKRNQIIISTHSPIALDQIDADELFRVQIVDFSKFEGTQVRKLNPKEENKARIYMEKTGSLSDYWLHSDLEE